MEILGKIGGEAGGGGGASDGFETEVVGMRFLHWSHHGQIFEVEVVGAKGSGGGKGRIGWRSISEPAMSHERWRLHGRQR